MSSSSSPTPVLKFRELSLGRRMPPTTRSQAHRQSLGHISTADYDENDDGGSSSEPETDSDSSLVDDDDQSVIRSPSKLVYKVDKLSADARLRVREAFKDPPRLSLQYCRLRDDVYAFQMTELVPRSIRIGSPDSPFATPKCSCREQQQKGGPPCKHLLWLLDQLVKQTLYDHDPTSPLTMTPDGYPEEIGDPFTGISTFHLDVLADGLRCDVVTPDSEEDSEIAGSDEAEEHLNSHRVHEAREMLSAVMSSSPDDYRPDLFSDPPSTGKKPVKRRDLEGTVFRMLLANNDFFHYFLSQMRSTDPVNDPFRKLSQRVDRVLHELDSYAASTSPPLGEASAEGPRDVAWAARHITGVVGLVRTSIFKRDRPLEPWERTSAARTLVHVLAAVVERNHDFVPQTSTIRPAAISRRDKNLYLRLVGDRDEDFVLGVLNLLPPDAAAQFLHSLEDILDQMGINGAPATYVEKFRSLMARLRRSGGGLGAASSSGAGSKRHGQSQGHDRGSKRMR
ncbi:SWIM zinc finger protein [Colletotrichum orchidophilum]|uniref:SWIM zinc finger protein n=1 Tax=Colletotrichum orchidophilum TaxID=1209926 RepID=A0A1G4AVB8_9PEZI|nr:SWIM zinc finger protein [Colletotrichum orchidophilum]OHE93045.1 SWIM zinc finger protein [Colletotrichum orchidophilum]